MKICLYYEFYHLLGEKFLKNIGGGVFTSYENQKQMLREQKIRFTEKWKDDCDILQINFQGINSLILINKAREQNKKVIIWGHTIAENFENSLIFSNSLSPIIKKMLIYFYGLADLVFCPTNYAKNVLVSYGLPEKKLIVRTNGVDTKKFNKKLSLRNKGRIKYKTKGLTIGNAGLVIPRKGVDVFTKCAKSFPKENFIWFGKVYGSMLTGSLSNSSPKNLLFTDYVDHEKDMPTAFNLMDIFFFPSHEETQGIAILEAAAVGLPILVRDIPAYTGWLFHNKNCLKAKNNKEFVEYLSLLIKDKKLRERLGQNARKLAEKESIAVQAKKLLKIYQDLIK
ncbi:MAG: glycosyltransferase family 4 protein [Candidatus Moraniibacteriota bacterium]